MVPFQSIFEALPGLNLILKPDFTIVAVTETYLAATLTKREEILGRGIFDVFPDNPGDPTADGVSNLRKSLNTVLQTKVIQTMAVQKYDILRPDGTFEEKYWSPQNKPVLNENNEVLYIIHRVEDVTEYIKAKQDQENKDQLTENLLQKVREMEMEIFNSSQELKLMNEDLETKVQLGIKELYKSEQQFRRTLDNLLEGIQIIGFDWKYIYVNKSLTRHGKYSKEELLGHTMMEKYPGIEHTELFKVLGQCMDDKTSKHLENEFIYPDGSSAWFELSVQPVDEGIFVLSVDITERKMAEANLQKLNEELEQKVQGRTALLEENIRQLKESEEKFQKVFDSSVASIAITRVNDFTYYDVNPSFVIMTGFTKEEIIGKTAIELGLIIDIDRRSEVIKQIQETGRAVNFELTVKNRFGKVVEVMSSAETILLNGEKLAINITTDITERKRVERQLAALNKELEAFTYSVSHDLRAPLRAINGFSDMLISNYSAQIDANGQRFLNIVKTNATNMGQLIDDLLNFSRIGRLNVNLYSVDMNEVFEQAISELHQDKLLPVTITIEKLPLAKADNTLMKQVAINLVSNAIKYSSKNPKPQIEVGFLECENEMNTYYVKDNGVGFDMKYTEKLFGVFQRLHSVKDFEGTGVGLAIVQRIITRHGGKVWAEAMEEKGATFYFTLPIV